MSNDLPIWLLDIDGVINPWPEDPPYFVWPTWTQVKVTSGPHDYPIKVAHGVRDFIIRVHEEGLAEIRWHTTWQQEANVLGRDVGLPEFPVQEAPEIGQWRYRNRLDWKVPAVFRVLGQEERPVLWTDDDHKRMLTQSQVRSLMELDCMMVTPDPDLGLTPRELEHIEHCLRNPVSLREIKKQERAVQPESVDGTPA